MASAPISSSRPHGSEKGYWERRSISHGQLTKLQKQGFFPPADLVPVRAGFTSFNGGVQAENFPNLSRGERVCFVLFLLRGVEFPIHPFLRVLLEYYGLQLHSFTPASILYIAGYVAVCELFLACEAHFELWRKLSCLIPPNQGDQYSKWEEPRYGASPGPNTCLACRRRLSKSGLPNGAILMMSLFPTQSEWVSPNFQVLC